MSTNEKTTGNIRIAKGAGTEPIFLPWKEGMTVADALQAAEITLEPGYSVALSRCRVEDPATTLLQPNDSMVVAGDPGNGHLDA